MPINLIAIFVLIQPSRSIIGIENSSAPFHAFWLCPVPVGHCSGRCSCVSVPFSTSPLLLRAPADYAFRSWSRCSGAGTRSHMIKTILCCIVSYGGPLLHVWKSVRCFCNSCRAASSVSSSIFCDSEGISVFASSAESGQSDPGKSAT